MASRFQKYLKLSKDLTEMRKVLECPICMTFATSGPIKQCKNGHHICDKCASRLDKCPSCKEKIDTRNLQLENLRDVTPIPCQNVENGCDVELKLKDLKNHQDQCEHGLLQCIVRYCEKRIPLKHVNSHLDIKHGEIRTQCLVSGSGKFGFMIQDHHFNKNGRWHPWRVKYNDEFFFLQMARFESGFWFVWVHYAGYAAKAKEYWCTIKVFSKNDPKSVVFNGDVIPMTVDYDTVLKMRNANGLVLFDSLVQQLHTKSNTNTDAYGLKLNVSFGKR
jgi:hypothetical protein